MGKASSEFQVSYPFKKGIDSQEIIFVSTWNGS
jgi:hypothetical protein